MKRRDATKLVAYGWIGLHFGLLAGCDDGDYPLRDVALGDDDALLRLNEMAAGLEGVDFVAPVCFRRMQAEDPLRALLSLLPTGDETLVEALRQQAARDFQEGIVIDIDGWKLSRTECLLLSGAALVQGLTEASELAAQPFRDRHFVDIDAWGPDRTIEGEIFNPVGNGRGGFWFRISSPVNGSVRVVLDGRQLATHFEPGTITASLDPEHMAEIIAEPGVHELALEDHSRRLRQPVGFLTVAERPPKARLADGSESQVFCQVDRWGPNRAVAGEAFNRQPDGTAGFWVRIGCAPRSSVLMLDGAELPTTVQSGLVTARVAHFAALVRGEHQLSIYDRASGEVLPIGSLVVQ